jgi:hypothetical protein
VPLSTKIPMENRSYYDWLLATATFERFIATHVESYGYGLIDMAARGMQVLAPRGFVPKPLVSDLGIVEFGSRETLSALLALPAGPRWQPKIDLCTGWGDIAQRMDAQFRAWL